MTAKIKVMGAALALAAWLALVSPGIQAAAAAESFGDTGSHWSRQAVEKSYALGLMMGYPGNVFRPEEPVTRLEAIAIVIRAMGLENEAKKLDWRSSGVRVPNGMFWGQGHLVMAVKKWLLDENIAPVLKYDAPIPREEVAALVAAALRDRLAARKGDVQKLNFSDTDEIGEAYPSYVADVTQNNIMQGLGENRFGPKEVMKRGQMAALMIKTVQDGWFDYGKGSIFTGVLSAVDHSAGTVAITTGDGTLVPRLLSSGTVLYKDSVQAVPADFKTGDRVLAVAGSDAVLKYMEAAGGSAPPPVNNNSGSSTSGSSSGSSATVPANTEIEAELRTVDAYYRMITVLYSNIRKEYEVETNAVITKSNDTVRIEALEQGDRIIFTLNDSGKIKKIEAKGESISKVTGKVTDLKTGSSPRIYVDSKRYYVDDNADILKDGDEIDLDEIMIGAEVSLDLDEDDLAIEIEVTDDEDITVEGTVKDVDEDDEEITIEQSNGLKFTLRVKSDCSYRDESSSSSNISDLDDIRTGWEVKLYLDNGKVRSLRVTDR